MSENEEQTNETSALALAMKAESRQITRNMSVVGAPKSLAETIEIAKVMAASGLYPSFKTAQTATAAIIVGAQYGLGPAQSLSAIHIVQGKPQLHYSLMLSKVREHPNYDYKILEQSDTCAKIEFFYKGESQGVSVFDAEDAKRQGTQNMAKYPSTMLIARAASDGVKRFCPDVLNGMVTYVQGEIEEPTMFQEETRGDSLREEMVARANKIAEAIEVEGKEVQEELF